ncbi:ATP-grasp domain-containing protein [Priestia aryabhattai]
MNVVILNRFPLDKIKYHEWFDSSHTIFLFSKIQDEVHKSDYHYAKFYEDYDSSNLVTQDIINLNKSIKIDKIIALSEKDILRAGNLRTFLHVPGMNKKTSWLFRDKVAMKNILFESNIPVTNFKEIDDITDIITFFDKYGKSVVKPRREAGSRGVTIIESQEDLQALLNSNYFSPDDNNKWMIEKFVDGTLFHVDGLFGSGKVQNFFISEYLTSCLDLINGKPLLTTTLQENDNNYWDIFSITERALRALSNGFPCLFHAEVFISNQGKPFINEIACRIGGGKIYPAIKRKFGFDLMKQYIEFEMGKEPLKFSIKDKGYAGHAQLFIEKGIVSYVDQIPNENWMLDCEINFKLGETLHAKNKKDFSIIIEGDSKEQIDIRLNEALKWFYESIEIE